MNAFQLHHGVLHAESLSLASIARDFGTPCYDIILGVDLGDENFFTQNNAALKRAITVQPPARAASRREVNSRHARVIL
jgi:hypothetical protein